MFFLFLFILKIILQTEYDYYFLQFFFAPVNRDRTNTSLINLIRYYDNTLRCYQQSFHESQDAQQQRIQNSQYTTNVNASRSTVYLAKLLKTFHVSSVVQTVRTLTTSTENTGLKKENNACPSSEACLMMIPMKARTPLFIRGCYYNDSVIFFTSAFFFLVFLFIFCFSSHSLPPLPLLLLLKRLCFMTKTTTEFCCHRKKPLQQRESPM